MQCLLLMTPCLHIKTLCFSQFFFALVLENMRKTKRGNDDLTRSHKNRSVRNAGEDVNKLLASRMLVLPLLLASVWSVIVLQGLLHKLILSLFVLPKILLQSWKICPLISREDRIGSEDLAMAEEREMSQVCWFLFSACVSS